MTSAKWILTKEERDRYIDALAPELSALRVRAGISQEELCNILGISRQTYSALELQKKPMSWSTYLSVIWFFDNNASTRDMLRRSPGFPDFLLNRMNEGNRPDHNRLGQTDTEFNELLQGLDDQAIHTIKTMLLVEYARCKKIPGDIVVKAFEGFELPGTTADLATEQALKNIRTRK